jgi:hypothetical protein
MAASKAEGAEAGGAGDGSFPLAAQIPLKDFTIPEFPPEASHLRELTLTADVKLDEYQSLVQDKPMTQPPLPNLPQSITHLTLELFGLGFPGTPPFLTRLARALPNLRSLTIFSCLIDGLDDASRKDAEKFFELVPLLRELHIIDSFARPGFFKHVGKILETRAAEAADTDGGDCLKLVDVSYTFRGHEDSDFLARVQAEELTGLVVKGVVGASFDLVPDTADDLSEDVVQDLDDPKKIAEGILPFASDGRASTALRKRFEGLSTGALRSVKVLNLGMYALRPVEVGEVVYSCAGGGDPGLVDLTVSVLLEDGWVDELVRGLEYKGVGASLEGIEVVGVPSRAQKGDDSESKLGLTVVEKTDVEKLAATACPKLGKFGMSILKVKSAPHLLFMKEEGSWERK